MRREFCLLLAALTFLSISAKTTDEKIREFYAETDRLYEQYLTYDSEEFAKSIETFKQLRKLLSKKPKELDENTFKNRVAERIQTALQTNDNPSLIKYIGQYQVFFPKDSKNTEYLETEAMLYYGKRDAMMMERSLAKLEKIIPKGDKNWQSRISFLKEKQREIYSQEGFREELIGVWVSDTINEKNGIPVFMFRIYNNGIVELLNQSEVYSGRLNCLNKGRDISENNPALRKPSLSPVRFSIGSIVDEETEKFIATFESKRFHQGSKDFADAAFGSAQKTLSTTSSIVAHGTPSTATTLSTGIIGLVTAGALMIWGNDLAASKMWETSINLTLQTTDKEEMEGVVEIFEKFGKSTTNEIEEKKELFNTKFYRVSAADDVLFADEKGNLFPLYCYNPYVQDELALYDYGEFVSNTNLKRKKGFLIPLYIFYWPAAIISDVNSRKSQKNRCASHNMQMMERVRVNNLRRRNEYLKYNLNM